MIEPTNGCIKVWLIVWLDTLGFECLLITNFKLGGSSPNCIAFPAFEVSN